MKFKQTFIPALGRQKYGNNYVAGTSSKSSRGGSTYIYGDKDVHNDSNNPSTTGSGQNNKSFLLFLSKTQGNFKGEEIALADAVDTVSIYGFYGTERADTYAGSLTIKDKAIEGLPASGMSVTFLNNGTPNAQIQITISKDISKSSGLLTIPCSVLLEAADDTPTGDDWATWNGLSANTKTLSLEYSWNISSNASSTYTLKLTNEVASINADKDWNILTGATRPTCTAKLYYGDDEMTGATYGISTPSDKQAVGVSINTSTGEITFGSNFSFKGTSLEVTVYATLSSVVVGTKIMTITKVVPGADGNSTSRWLVVSTDIIKFNPNTNKITPSSVTAKVMKQVNENAPIEDSATTIYYGWDTDNPLNVYTKAITPDASKEYLMFALKNDNSEIYESQSVIILSDGKNGADGTGVTPYVLELSNENASINADSNGNILAGAYRPKCAAKLFYGNDLVTGATYDFSASCDYTGMTWPYTSTGASLSCATNFNFSELSMEVTVNAYIDSVLYGTKIMTISKNCAGQQGPKGDSGVGISSMVEWYGISSTNTSEPTSYSKTFTNPNADYPYLWNYEVVTYTNGTTAKTTAAVIGNYSKDGSDGKNGRGISSVTEYYAINNSNTSSAGTYSTTFKAPTSANPYLWNYEVITYTDGTTSKTTAAVIGNYSKDGTDGKDGSDGQDAVSYWMDLSASELHADSANSVTPTFIEMRGYRQIGENEPENITSACTFYYGVNTSSPSKVLTGNTCATLSSLGQYATYNYLNIHMYLLGSKRDGETVSILHDGKNGSDGKDGADGRQGAALRGPVQYENQTTSRRWCNGKLTNASYPEDAEYIDIIYRIEDGEGVYYYCNTSYNGSASDSWSSVSKYWTKADQQFDFIATNLLLAKNAKIDFLNGQGIYLSNSAGTVTAGLQAATSGNSVVMWAGANEPANANLTISYNGDIIARSGVFGGYVRMPFTYIDELEENFILSSATIGEYSRLDLNWKGNLQSHPSGATYGWGYYNTVAKVYYVYRGSWYAMTYKGADGYIADYRCNIVVDSSAADYGMLDGADLILPNPSSAYNGYSYHIVMEPNIATKAASLNHSVTLRTNSKTNTFRMYFHTSTSFYNLPYAVKLYGGSVTVTCIPTSKDRNTYAWAITECTGGGDCYNSGNTLMWSFGMVCSYNTGSDNDYCINRIVAQSSFSTMDKATDTLRIQRT